MRGFTPPTLFFRIWSAKSAFAGGVVDIENIITPELLTEVMKPRVTAFVMS